ncbi:histidine phosphatase family protein [uncultured Tateyamaria sp.]|uniref:histidine phosphatase family protein n=1 Tax=uncultured Tateyamaria sp. TaxID=455651 RepID=UPI0026391ACC|nr:histidine phosphatase family protein [uncultured Tateyamaria sp.]
MSHITLIRHGQANNQAKDEASYDQLSPLGHQQARWLGAHLTATNQHHRRLYTGTLRRHRETAQGMNTGLTPTQDPRLNELEYFTLATALETEHGVAIPTEQAHFAAHLPRVFAAWADGILEGAPETFGAFETRVRDALSEITAGTGPALVVTSGGLISMAMRQHLDLSIKAMANVALAIMNTSVHRFYPIGGTWAPVMFNAVPHLEMPDRHHAQTHF